MDLIPSAGPAVLSESVADPWHFSEGAQPLFLPGIRLNCDPRFWKISKLNTESLAQATQFCEKAPNCKYFSYDKNSHKTELCAESEFVASENVNVTSGEHFERVVKSGVSEVESGATLLTNKRADCDFLLRSPVPNVFRAKDAVLLCKNTNGCTHWSLSSIGSPVAPFGAQQTSRSALRLCGGKGPSFSQELGTVSGLRTGIFPRRDDQNDFLNPPRGAKNLSNSACGKDPSNCRDWNYGLPEELREILAGKKIFIKQSNGSNIMPKVRFFLPKDVTGIPPEFPVVGQEPERVPIVEKYDKYLFSGDDFKEAVLKSEETKLSDPDPMRE